MRTSKPLGVALALVSGLLAAGVARGQSAAQVLKETGVSAGLAVVVGTTGGKLEADLARTERLVVHGLALDDARRHHLRSREMP